MGTQPRHVREASVRSFLAAILVIPLSSLVLAQQKPDAAKGYTGAYTAPGDPKPYSTGPLPQVDTGPGRDVTGPNNTAKTVKAVPCKATAQETDGTTTCIGIPDKKSK
jgi:hypothetical protein